ncbi:MAG TPA: flagellar motor switch protein FliN [Bryobacteraceae bacterium]|nr:flagellar motor switch protein FliN [Bryobacteraceae bacterium]
MSDASRNSMGILMQVEVPVSVSLGRTRMRIKDLLSLTPGSVVELDQHSGDEVEIRVNNCVIAQGEVVGVDGNYGVRILRIAGDGGAEAIRELT